MDITRCPFSIIMDNLLYIGLHGYAGSGKDTVAKALRLMLSYNWESFDDFKAKWQDEAFKRLYATYGENTGTQYGTQYGNATLEDTSVFCIAFADQLKYICAEMFGIPVKHFYYNKENGWIDITGTFRYVEELPYNGKVVTADEFYYLKNSNTVPETPMWMSLREILVYVGTYICQPFINKQTFTNGANNRIKMVAARNHNLRYVICTDVRFYHEIEFIKKHHGINIDIIRPEVKQLNNVAEHDLDGVDNFDIVIYNDSTYDDLLTVLWDAVHNNEVFKNQTVKLASHDGTNNYIRKIDENKWQCCFEHGMCRVAYSNGKIAMIDPSGGPALSIGTTIPDVGTITSIDYDDDIEIHVLTVDA